MGHCQTMPRSPTWCTVRKRSQTCTTEDAESTERETGKKSSSSPMRSLMPQRVTISQARVVTLWKSFSAPVVISPVATSSATCPPSPTAMRSRRRTSPYPTRMRVVLVGDGAVSRSNVDTQAAPQGGADDRHERPAEDTEGEEVADRSDRCAEAHPHHSSQDR